MAEQKLNNSSGGTRLRVEANLAVIFFTAAGLAGAAIPIWYVHTHLAYLDSFPILQFFGPIIFLLVVILFIMIFVLAAALILFNVKRFLENFHQKNNE